MSPHWDQAVKGIGNLELVDLPTVLSVVRQAPIHLMDQMKMSVLMDG